MNYELYCFIQHSTPRKSGFRKYSTFNIFILFALTLLLFSCKRANTDACDNKCQNKSKCEDGTCVCELGYTGEYCEKKFSYQFLGVYSVKDIGTYYYIDKKDAKKSATIPINKTHSSVITQGKKASQVNITNYFGNDFTGVANVDANSIKIMSGLKIFYNDTAYPVKSDTNSINNRYFPKENKINFSINDTSWTVKNKDTLAKRITKCISTFIKQ